MKAAIIKKLRRDNALDFSPQQIIVSNGAKQVIFNAFMATLEVGQEVLMCAPYFGQYKDMVTVLGGIPKPLQCPAEDGFLISPNALEEAITPNTRWLILNLPSNPAGAVYTLEQLAALGEVLERHPNVMVLSDEIYEHIIFDGRTFISFATACPNLRDRILLVNGVSKAYAMTGWRVGYGAGHKTLIAAMTKVQSQISSGVCSVAQAAAEAALSGPQDEVVRFKNAFEKRRDLVVSKVAKIRGLTLDPPGGAFYAFIGCKEYIGCLGPDGTVIKDDIQFCQYLLNEAKVAAVPGSAYGLSGFFRLSTACSETVLCKAMDRIKQCVDKLTYK